nr:RNA-dependent RNA polymerase [Phytophthora castaneae RNA virus 3]
MYSDSVFGIEKGNEVEDRGSTNPHGKSEAAGPDSGRSSAFGVMRDMICSVGEFGALRLLSGIVAVHDCLGSGMPDFSQMDKRLWRPKVRVRHGFRRFGMKWGNVLERYAQATPRETKPYWDLVREAGECCCETGIIAWLKELGRLCTALTVHLGRGPWTYFCDIHVLGGYDTVLNRVDVLAEVAGQVGSEKPASKLEEYRDEVRCLVRETLHCVRVRAEVKQGFSEWVRFRDNWSAPGACSIGEAADVVIEANGTVQNVRARGKFGKTLRMSDEELKEAAFLACPAQVSPFRKIDEPVKTRAVYAYDTRSYLRCSYVSDLMGDYNTYGIWTPLGCSNMARAEQRLAILGRLGRGSRAVSLDQSAFDLNQPKWAVKLAMEEVFAHVARFCAPEVRDEVVRLGEVECASFEDAVVPGVCAWKRGVPSGHKWTALIDSLLNRAESLLAARERGVSVRYGLWQGDDAVLFESGTPRMSWAEAYALLGLEVNSKKTWVDPDSCEFLHEFYSGKTISAFPARSYRSVLWGRPAMGLSVFLSKTDYLKERLETLQKCARRGLVKMDKVAVSLLVRKGLSADKAREVLCTPRFYGGLGWSDPCRTGFRLSGGKVSYRRCRLESPVFGKKPNRVTEFAALKRLGATLPMPTTDLVATAFAAKGVERALPRAVLGGRVALKMSWAWTDKIPDPWMTKLRLEAAVGRVIPWRDDYVPDAFIRNAIVGSRKAYSVASKWMSESFNLDDCESTGQSRACIADWGNRTWLSFLSFGAHTGLSDMLPYWRGLARKVVERLTYFSPALVVRV